MRVSKIFVAQGYKVFYNLLSKKQFLTADGHERTLLGEGNVLHLDWGSGCTIVSTCQNSLSYT